MGEHYIAPARFSQRRLLVRSPHPYETDVDIEVGNVMGRCSCLVVLLAVPLLRSPQDIPTSSYRRPFRTCSMADESRQRYCLAEECRHAILSHCSRKWADIHAHADVFITCLRRTSQPVCVIPALLHGFVEHQTILFIILPQLRQRHTKANDTLVLCPCIYACFIFYLFGHDRLQMSGGSRWSR